MYEHALHYSNKALKIDPGHSKSLYRKAKALGFLFKFEESIKILT